MGVNPIRTETKNCPGDLVYLDPATHSIAIDRGVKVETLEYFPLSSPYGLYPASVEQIVTRNEYYLDSGYIVPDKRILKFVPD